MPGKVILEVARGPLQGQVFTFKEHDTFIFGRSSDCHTRLPTDDKTVSNYHFLLEINPPDVRLQDLGSRNGTYVNNTKHGGRSHDETAEDARKRGIPEVDLKNGDKISVGHTVFKVIIEGAEETICQCCKCGLEIPLAFKSLSQWKNGKFICPPCREKAAQEKVEVVEKEGVREDVTTADKIKSLAKIEQLTAAKRASGNLSPTGPLPKMSHVEPSAPEPASKPKETKETLRCMQCGKDVSAELGNRREGDYLCAECRSKVDFGHVAAFLNMMMGKGVTNTACEIPGYIIEKMLGKGNMGAVYLAHRKQDNTVVAIKIMLANVAVEELARQKFLREMNVMKSLTHPNIVNLIDCSASGMGFYFVMEYCGGGCVQSLLERRGGKIPLAEAKTLMLQALEGLHYAHEHKFVHRDIKPQNILLTAQDNGVAKIADFSMSKNFQDAGLSGMTAMNISGGTLAFMPREQLVNFRYVTPVSDVWSIAATFYYMLTGQLPREFPKGVTPVNVILKGEIVPIRKRSKDLPKKLMDVLDRALSDKPQNRYADAAEFHKELSKV